VKSWWIEPKARWWFPTLSGKVSSSTTNAPGTGLTASGDLALKTSRNFIWPALTTHFAERHRVTLSYLPMDYSGNRTLAQSITFAGSTFGAGTRLQSELSLTDVSAAYQYDLLKASSGSLFLSIQAHYLDLKAHLKGTNGSTVTDVSKRLQIPVPTIGGGLQLAPFRGLSLNGDFNIFKMGIKGFKGELIESQAGLTLHPLAYLGDNRREWCSTFAPTFCVSPRADSLALSAGFRYFRVLARDNVGANQVDWLQQGPYIDLSVKF
jgi:hypothetical protein